MDKSRVDPFKENTIIVGDCLDIMAQMPDGCVDLVVTDPPYGIKFKSHSAKIARFDVLDGDDVEFNLAEYWEELYRVTRNGGALYLYCRWDVAHRWSKIINPDSQIILPRGRCSMGDLSNYSTEYEVALFKRKGKHTIDATSLKIPNYSHIPNPPLFKRRIGNLWLDVISNEAWERADHPTQKTVQSASKMISVSSNPDDIVADFFMGSGTTAMAANKLGRDYFGCDINPEYVKRSLERLNEEK